MHGLSQSPRLSRRPGAHRPTRPHRGGNRPRPGNGRDPAARLRGRRPGSLLRQREGLRLSDGRATSSGPSSARAFCSATPWRRCAIWSNSRSMPSAFWKRPWRYRDVPGALLHSLPQMVQSGPILAHQTTMSQLPQLKCWPRDGGAFVTLPLVYTEDVDRPGWRHSNLGMYRVQLSGNQYAPDRGSRSALPDSSRHRRPSRQGVAPRRPVSRQRLRRRAAGVDAGGGDAAAGGDAGAGVRRDAGRPACAAGATCQ